MPSLLNSSPLATGPTRRRRRALALPLAACALAGLLLTGCSGPGQGSAAGSATGPAGGPATDTASPSPTGLSAATVQQMQQKVDAAQSAADAADSDAANDPGQ
jgi:hypothetical protein